MSTTLPPAENSFVDNQQVAELQPAEIGGLGNIISREQPTVDPAVTALIQEWQTKITNAKTFWAPVFDRMREEQRFAAGKQWPGTTKRKELDNDQEKYVANFVQRSVNQKVASIYAKNPKAVVRRRQKLDFALWDGNQDTLVMAQQMVMQNPGDQLSAAIVNDYQHGMQNRQMLDRVAKTLELVWESEFNQCIPPSKRQMKSLVRRVETCRVGYLKLGYQREGDPTMLKSSSSQVNLTDRVHAMAAISADISDGVVDDDNPDIEKLKAMTLATANDVESGEMEVTKEGLTLDFPKATSIIVDPDCTELDGFVNASWVAQEYIMTTEAIKRQWGIDVQAGGATIYSKSGVPTVESGKPQTTVTEQQNIRYCVWEIYDKVTQLRAVICDGYVDFIEPFDAPKPRLERFWPWFSLVFNACEIEVNEPEEDVTIYPPSTVRLLMPIQKEKNRAQESLRDHRNGSRPAYGVAAGKLEQQDRDLLAARPANAVIEIHGLAPGEKISDVIQQLPTVPIDPALYETSQLERDMFLVGGQQEANMGTTTGATATESQIAEASRLTSTGSNIDDLDDFLTDVARSAGEILLMELPKERATEIAGPGAVWPDLDRNEIKKEVYMEIQAASTGRPNRSLELNNFRELAPVMMQLPGLNPEFMVKQAVQRLDDRIEIEDAYTPGMPSISALDQPQQQPEHGAEPKTPQEKQQQPQV